MRRDERIVVFGEDVADATREADALRDGKVKGKGGVFKLTSPASRPSSAPTASGTRRWPRPTSSAAPSAWQYAA